MEEDWKTYKLGDLIEINTNTIKKGQTKWIHYIDIKSVGSGTYVDPKRIQFDDAPSRARRLLLEGDTVISSVRPNLKSYFYSQNLKNFTIASTGFAVLSPRKIDSRFLYYLTTNDRYIDFLVKSCTGSAYPAFGPNVIVESEVTIPRSVPEQHAIASILSALDDKIELNLQMNKTLEEMAMTLYKHWFVDFGPFRDGEFVPSELGEIPKGWETISLGDIAIIKGGKRLPKKEQLQSIPNTHPYIRVRDFNSMYLSLQGMEYVPDNIFPKISSYIVNEGDVLLSIVGTVGSVSIVGDNLNNASLTENSVKVSLLENGLTPELLYLQLISYKGQDEIKQKTVGSTQPKLPIYNIKSLKLSFPRNYGVIGEVSSTIKGWFELIYSNNIENNILITLRDTLLPKLISGEVRVKDAALTIDEAL